MTKRKGGGRRQPRDYSDAPYEVGKGKPPKSTQFQPGHSGWPGGRPRKGVMTKADLAQAIYIGLAEPVEIHINGQKETRSAAEAIALRQINKAMAGDSKAAAFVFSKALEVAPHQNGVRKIITEVIHGVLDKETGVTRMLKGGAVLDDGEPPPGAGERKARFADLVCDNRWKDNVKFLLDDDGRHGRLWGRDVVLEQAVGIDMRLHPRDGEPIDIRITESFHGAPALFEVIAPSAPSWSER